MSHTESVIIPTLKIPKDSPRKKRLGISHKFKLRNPLTRPYHVKESASGPTILQSTKIPKIFQSSDSHTSSDSVDEKFASLLRANIFDNSILDSKILQTNSEAIDITNNATNNAINNTIDNNSIDNNTTDNNTIDNNTTDNNTIDNNAIDNNAITNSTNSDESLNNSTNSKTNSSFDSDSGEEIKLSSSDTSLSSSGSREMANNTMIQSPNINKSIYSPIIIRTRSIVSEDLPKSPRIRNYLPTASSSFSIPLNSLRACKSTEFRKSEDDGTPRIDGPEEVIGRGTYGVVKTVNNQAYKYYDDWPCLVREWPCLVSCQGPGVVEITGYNPRKQCIKMKLYQTDLATWLSRNGHRHNLFKFRQHILHNIIQGLVTIHSRGCVHGDLKPSNILISSTLGTKLTKKDFECPSSIKVALADLGNVCPNGQGHIKYITPSHRPIISSKHCSNLQHWVDVYALALVVMELWISDYDSWAHEVCALQDNIPLDNYLTSRKLETDSPDISPGRTVRHSQKLFVELLLKHTSLTGRTKEYFTNIIHSCRQSDKIPNIYQVARDCGVKIVNTACALQYDIGGILSPRSIAIDNDTLGNLQQLISTTSPTPFISQRSICVFRYVLTNMNLAVEDLAPIALIIMRMVSHLTSNNTTYSNLTEILNRIKCPRTVQELLELEIRLLNDKGFCHNIILGYV